MEMKTLKKRIIWRWGRPILFQETEKKAEEIQY